MRAVGAPDRLPIPSIASAPASSAYSGIARRAYDRTMHGNRSPAWWPTRILLAIGIGAVLLIGLYLVALGGPVVQGGNWSIELGPPHSWGPVGAIAAFLVPLVGLVWMIRIYRSPLEGDPPPWRYRDH